MLNCYFTSLDFGVTAVRKLICSVVDHLFLSQVYGKRKRAVKEGQEMERMMSHSHFYMTEESDDADDPNTIVLHKLQWRSESKQVLI